MCIIHKSSDLIEVNLSIQHCNFINGTADRGGGGLSIQTFRRGSLNSMFTHNFVTVVYNLGDGGGVYIEMYISNIVRIMASRFSKNVAGSQGWWILHHHH